jgi:hypothetical protein
MKPSELYERCNETELYQIARASGVVVQPATPKDLLIKYILGEELPPPEAHEVDEWRLAIMGFVIEHRKRLEVQLRCPAKSMDPRACFQCVDHQVSSCLVENKQNLHLIRIHKKPIEKPTGDVMAETETVLDPKNAPRDKAKLKATGTFQLRKLAEALGILPGDPEKMAWNKLSVDERVEEISKRLTELDAKAGGAPATRTPATAPATSETPGTSVPAVDPAAFRAAQDATAAGPGLAAAGKRQPKEGTSNGVAPAATDIAAVLMAMQALNGTNSALVTAQTGLLAELKVFTTNIEGKIGAMEKAVANAAAEQTRMVKVALSAILTVAEERGVASRFEILADAVGEAERLDAMIAEVSGAKKAGKAA